jgi:2-succinyl-6-hydroxy-2,4-cyclohexadiene-1-carboxylate synthase
MAADPPRPVRRSPVAERRDIDVGDGLRLHVMVDGAGPPLVLLHGFTGSVESWAPLRAAFGAAHTAIAVDLPGHGRSSAPPEPSRYGLDRFADDLARVLDTLGMARVALLGYSMGGRAALRFALRHPDRVAALALESTSPGIADAAQRADRLAADLALADSIEREGVQAFVARWERLPLWESQRELPESVRASLRTQREANRPDGLANSLRGAGAGVDPSVLDRLPALRTPTLLVAGALDTKFATLARRMERVLPRGCLTVVPRAGHAVHLERPSELAAAVTAFLRDIPHAAGRWR